MLFIALKPTNIHISHELHKNKTYTGVNVNGKTYTFVKNFQDKNKYNHVRKKQAIKKAIYFLRFTKITLIILQ